VRGSLFVYIAAGCRDDDPNNCGPDAAHRLCCSGHTIAAPATWLNLSPADHIMASRLLLARCDAIVMLPLWHRSDAAKIWREFARSHGIRVYYYPNLPSSVDNT
jgi:hypothetical protein